MLKYKTEFEKIIQEVKSNYLICQFALKKHPINDTKLFSFTIKY